MKECAAPSSTRSVASRISPARVGAARVAAGSACWAVLRLLPHSLGSHFRSDMLERLRRLATTVPAYRDMRGKADDAARALLQLTAADARYHEVA